MKHYLLVCIILLLGLGLRFFWWQNFPFGFDQTQILQNAESISHGHITLIGPRTGPAPLFTGPLIYYWTAVWIRLVPPPYTLIISTLLLHLITGLVLYLLLNRYFTKISRLGLFIWSVSAFLVSLDRIPWNPNLMFLAASCVFIPLCYLIEFQNIRWQDLGIISLGVLLGYQAHFSGLFLLPLAFSGFSLMKKPKWQVYGICLVAFTVTLLPTVLFDLRHEWLNLKGVIVLLTDHSGSATPYLTRLSHDIFVSLENGGKFFFLQQSFFVKIICGLILIILGIIKSKSPTKIKQWYLIWLIGIPLIFSLYSGDKPEYYYSLQFPVWVTLIAWIIYSLKKPLKLIALATLVLVNGYYLKDVYKPSSALTIQSHVDVANFVNQRRPKKIIYFMPHGTTAGFEYLIHLDQNSSNTSTIEYPKNPAHNYQFENNSFGVLP